MEIMRRIDFKSSRVAGTNVRVRCYLNIIGVLLISLGLAASALGETTTKVSLVLSAETARPGETVMAGIRLQMQPKWHSYWVNGGDSGYPTKVDWMLPPGVTAGETQWPVPEKLLTPPLITYVYADEAILVVPLKINADAPAGSMDIKAKVTWQECSDQVCVLGHATVEAKLLVGDASKPSADAALMAAAMQKIPKTGGAAPISAHWEKDDDTRPMVIEWNAAGKMTEVDFFPYASDKYEVKGETERRPDADGKIRIRKLVSKSGADWPGPV